MGFVGQAGFRCPDTLPAAAMFSPRLLIFCAGSRLAPGSFPRLPTDSRGSRGTPYPAPAAGRLLAKDERWLRKNAVIWQEMRDVYTASLMPADHPEQALESLRICSYIIAMKLCFAWDETKNRSNQHKHGGIAFEIAAQVIRIISARRATPRERKRYEQENR